MLQQIPDLISGRENEMSREKNLQRMGDAASGDDRRKNLPDKVKKHTLFDKRTHSAVAMDQLRRSTRKYTMKNSNDTIVRQIRDAMKSTGNHATASARAIDDRKAPLAPFLNEASVSALKENKAYKDGTFRIHFKGDRKEIGIFGPIIQYTSGNPLAGARIARSNWSGDQTRINQYFGKKLLETPGFEGAKNSKGYHGAEIAHLRAQHAGGLTDALGAQSASWHSNVEDMAREEGQAHLARQFGDNVRIKSTSYIHEFGDRAGTVKASRHKIYFQNNDGKWEKKFDHLQDGGRGNINKSEVKNLKETVKSLSPNSPNISLHGSFTKGILRDSSVSTQKTFIPKINDSASSPYFTDLRAKSTTLSGTNTHTYTGQKAASVLKGFLSDAAARLSNKK